MTSQAIIERLLIPAIVDARFVMVPTPWSKASADSWSFSNGRVRLDVILAVQTGELSLTLEHPHHDGAGVPLHQLFVRNGDPDLAWATHGLILHQPDRAEKAIQRLARAIERNAAPLVRLTVTEVEALYDEWVAAGRREMRRESAKRKIAEAEAFWHEGQYAECARLLAEIEPMLSPAQQKRLTLARRRAGST